MKGKYMKKINDDTETSGIVTFHPKYHEKVKRFVEIEKKENKKTQEGGRVPFSSAADKRTIAGIREGSPSDLWGRY